MGTSNLKQSFKLNRFLYFFLLAAVLAISASAFCFLRAEESTKKAKKPNEAVERKTTLGLNDILFESRRFIQSTPPELGQVATPTKTATAPCSVPVAPEIKDPEITTSLPEAARQDFLVVIDPGHQARADLTTEKMAPWSTETKAKVTGGATGVATGVKEHELMLEIAILLREELNNLGIRAILTRTRNEVNISNRQRAEVANSLGADLFFRIHANSSTDRNASGAIAFYQPNHPSIAQASEKSKKAAQIILDNYCSKTGLKNLGAFSRSDLTGLNWSKSPAVLLELGFLSNESDEYFLVSDSKKQLIAKSLAEGIAAYLKLVD